MLTRDLDKFWKNLMNINMCYSFILSLHTQNTMADRGALCFQNLFHLFYYFLFKAFLIPIDMNFYFALFIDDIAILLYIASKFLTGMGNNFFLGINIPSKKKSKPNIKNLLTFASE